MWVIYFRKLSVVTHSSSSSEDFHDKKNLYEFRSRHGRFLEVVSKHFDNFCRRQETKTHLTADLSLSFLGNRDAKASYWVIICSFIGINFQILMEVKEN